MCDSEYQQDEDCNIHEYFGFKKLILILSINSIIYKLIMTGLLTKNINKIGVNKIIIKGM